MTRPEVKVNKGVPTALKKRGFISRSKLNSKSDYKEWAVLRVLKDVVWRPLPEPVVLRARLKDDDLIATDVLRRMAIFTSQSDYDMLHSQTLLCVWRLAFTKILRRPQQEIERRTDSSE